MHAFRRGGVHASGGLPSQPVPGGGPERRPDCDALSHPQPCIYLQGLTLPPFSHRCCSTFTLLEFRTRVVQHVQGLMLQVGVWKERACRCCCCLPARCRPPPPSVQPPPPQGDCDKTNSDAAGLVAALGSAAGVLIWVGTCFVTLANVRAGSSGAPPGCPGGRRNPAAASAACRAACPLHACPCCPPAVWSQPAAHPGLSGRLLAGGGHVRAAPAAQPGGGHHPGASQPAGHAVLRCAVQVLPTRCGRAAHPPCPPAPLPLALSSTPRAPSAWATRSSCVREAWSP